MEETCFQGEKEEEGEEGWLRTFRSQLHAKLPNLRRREPDLLSAREGPRGEMFQTGVDLKLRATAERSNNKKKGAEEGGRVDGGPLR